MGIVCTGRWILLSCLLACLCLPAGAGYQDLVPAELAPQQAEEDKPSNEAARLEEGKQEVLENLVARFTLEWRDHCGKDSPQLAQGADFEFEGRKALGTFLENHPVKLGRKGGMESGPAPIKHAKYGEFLAGAECQALLDENLSKQQAQEFRAAIARRRSGLRQALIVFMDAHLAKGVGLSSQERKDLKEALGNAADSCFESGFVQLPNAQIGKRVQAHSIESHLKKSGFLNALSEPRAEILRRFMKKGRTKLDDFYLEIEFLRLEHGLPQEKVDLLRGWAITELTRGGKTIKFRAGKEDWLASRTRIRGNRFWNKLVKTTLELGPEEELPSLPMREELLPEKARAALLVAILDYRAVLTTEQRDGLTPLLEKYVDRHERSDRKQQSLSFPKAFGLQVDGELSPALLRGTSSSVSIRSYVSTVRETLTPLQRTALGMTP